MRHIGATALAAIALCGCATDNNTLIFGTSTTFGLDASAAATEGGSPHVTVGYKRAEGVWMPLRQVPALKAADGSYDSVNGIYQSINSETGKAERKDAYSVFASIGAKFNTGASASQVQAGAGLAQFFATGAAAVNVSQNEALVTVLKVSDPRSSEAQATAVDSAAKNDTLDSVRKGMTTADQSAADDIAMKRKALFDKTRSLAVACATAADGSYRWSEIVATIATFDDEQKSNLKQIPADKLDERLRQNPTLAQSALVAGAKPPFNCPGA